jgi:DNA-binding LacI/PurR family transcriptional regulator
VTLQTIADRLGISRTTVSNAWSRPDQLSSELRDRILAVADELGYPGPDPAARGLRRGRADAIGMLLTEALTYAFGDAYARDLLQGVAVATDAADTGLLLVPLPVGRQIGQALRGAAVDGFIVYSMPDGHPAVDLLRHRGIPLVTIDGPRLDDVPFVGIDDRAAAAELTGRVLAAGHRRLLVLTFRVVDDDRAGVVDDERIERAAYRVSRERLIGIREACRAAGLARADLDIHEVGLNTRDAGARVVAAALEHEDAPTAVVAISDELAAGAVDAAHARGWAVPQDLSVVGYDDLALARQLDLTTVRQPAADKGRLAARQLLGAVERGDVELPFSVVERDSIGAPRR